MYRFFLFLTLAWAASDYGEYHLYKNVGGVFYDYSGNGYHAINGQNVLPDSHDVTSTSSNLLSAAASTVLAAASPTSANITSKRTFSA